MVALEFLPRLATFVLGGDGKMCSSKMSPRRNVDSNIGIDPSILCRSLTCTSASAVRCSAPVHFMDIASAKDWSNHAISDSDFIVRKLTWIEDYIDLELSKLAIYNCQWLFGHGAHLAHRLNRDSAMDALEHSPVCTCARSRRNGPNASSS